jgi:P63C domain
VDRDKRKAGKIGGARRAEILSPSRRLQIARHAAAARWGGRPPKATHKGSFEREFGIDVDCYVLDDAGKTAVVSQTGLGSAFGFSPRGNALPRFLATQAMSGVVGAELGERLTNPLKFQWGSGGAGPPPINVHGFDATVLIDIANAIIAAEAEGKLSNDRYEGLIRQAHIIVGASAKSGIKYLVYALAGYSPTAEEVITAFKTYVQEEARKYEPEFPNELYLEWYRLYDIPVPERGKPWQFKYLTVNHIYYPLARSSGKILTLLRAHKAQGGDRAKKLFQFLNEIGARALRMHLGRVLEMAESSPDRATYEQKINERFGIEQQLDLPIPMPPPAQQEAAN